MAYLGVGYTFYTFYMFSCVMYRKNTYLIGDIAASVAAVPAAANNKKQRVLSKHK